jgi:hypothetical protein
VFVYTYINIYIMCMKVLVGLGEEDSEGGGTTDLQIRENLEGLVEGVLGTTAAGAQKSAGKMGESSSSQEAGAASSHLISPEGGKEMCIDAYL